MDLFVGVLTDATGNGGARLATPPVGPDNAPIDAKALILVDENGTPIDVSGVLGGGGNPPLTVINDAVIADEAPSFTLFVDATANDVQVTLPPAVNNESTYIIRRVDQSVFDMTIIPTGADSVDGDTDAALFPGESMTFGSNLTNTWWLL